MGQAGRQVLTPRIGMAAVVDAVRDVDASPWAPQTRLATVPMAAVPWTSWGLPVQHSLWIGTQGWCPASPSSPPIQYCSRLYMKEWDCPSRHSCTQSLITDSSLLSDQWIASEETQEGTRPQAQLSEGHGFLDFFLKTTKKERIIFSGQCIILGYWNPGFSSFLLSFHLSTNLTSVSLSVAWECYLFMHGICSSIHYWWRTLIKD